MQPVFSLKFTPVNGNEESNTNSGGFFPTDIKKKVLGNPSLIVASICDNSESH